MAMYSGPVCVWNLIPGDRVIIPGSDLDEATFIKSTRHPLYRDLKLVIWRMSDNSISLDALRGDQEVGSVRHVTNDERRDWLQKTFNTGSHA